MKTRALFLLAGLMVAARAGAGTADASIGSGSTSSTASAGKLATPSPSVPVSVGPTAEVEQKLANPEMEDGYLKLGFDRLAGFKFVPPPFDPVADPKVAPPTGEEQIPKVIKGWSGHKAMVTGFMQPTKLEKGKCTEFMLMANQMACCFGGVPNLNDWVIVRMPQGAPVIMDVPVSFYGTLKVGAAFENGYLTGIYELAGEKMAEIKG